MKRCEIFACFSAVILMGLAAQSFATEMQKQKINFDLSSEQMREAIRNAVIEGEIVVDEKDDVFLDVPLAKEGQFTYPSKLIGPCKWSVYGKRIDHAKERYKQNDQSLLPVNDIDPRREHGFELGLRCRESADRYELSFGMGENRTSPYYANDLLNVSREDKSIFIQFKRRIGP